MTPKFWNDIQRSLEHLGIEFSPEWPEDEIKTRVTRQLEELQGNSATDEAVIEQVKEFLGDECVAIKGAGHVILFDLLIALHQTFEAPHVIDCCTFKDLLSADEDAIVLIALLERIPNQVLGAIAHHVTVRLDPNSSPSFRSMAAVAEARRQLAATIDSWFKVWASLPRPQSLFGEAAGKIAPPKYQRFHNDKVRKTLGQVGSDAFEKLRKFLEETRLSNGSSQRSLTGKLGSFAKLPKAFAKLLGASPSSHDRTEFWGSFAEWIVFGSAMSTTTMEHSSFEDGVPENVTKSETSPAILRFGSPPEASLPTSEPIPLEAQKRRLIHAVSSNPFLGRKQNETVRRKYAPLFENANSSDELNGLIISLFFHILVQRLDQVSAKSRGPAWTALQALIGHICAELFSATEIPSDLSLAAAFAEHRVTPQMIQEKVQTSDLKRYQDEIKCRHESCDDEALKAFGDPGRRALRELTSLLSEAGPSEAADDEAFRISILEAKRTILELFPTEATISSFELSADLKLARRTISAVATSNPDLGVDNPIPDCLKKARSLGQIQCLILSILIHKIQTERPGLERALQAFALFVFRRGLRRGGVPKTPSEWTLAETFIKDEMRLSRILSRIDTSDTALLRENIVSSSGIMITDDEFEALSDAAIESLIELKGLIARKGLPHERRRFPFLFEDCLRQIRRLIPKPGELAELSFGEPRNYK